MRVEFRQGVPEGCVNWLCDNVGRGNIFGMRDGDDYNMVDGADYDWFYKRVEQEIPNTDSSIYRNFRYVPTITVKDPKLATLFVLRWS
jgi:hypothetical protein